MEILGFREFNEKLDIQPITKERLARGVSTVGKYVTIGTLDWSAVNASTLVDNGGNLLRERTDYFEHNGDIYYTKEGAAKIVPNGWRLPTTKDIEHLFHIVNDAEVFISKDFGGTDKYGLGLRLLGFYSYDMPFDNYYNGYGKNANYVIDIRTRHTFGGDVYSGMMLTYSSSLNYWKITIAPIDPKNGQSVRFVRTH